MTIIFLGVGSVVLNYLGGGIEKPEPRKMYSRICFS
jgi:hypothetical protein